MGPPAALRLRNSIPAVVGGGRRETGVPVACRASERLPAEVMHGLLVPLRPRDLDRCLSRASGNRRRRYSTPGPIWGPTWAKLSATERNSARLIDATRTQRPPE